MKIYIVERLDTNDLISLDKEFKSRQDAEQYVNEQEKKHKAMQYFIRSSSPEQTEGRIFNYVI